MSTDVSSDRLKRADVFCLKRADVFRLKRVDVFLAA